MWYLSIAGKRGPWMPVVAALAITAVVAGCGGGGGGGKQPDLIPPTVQVGSYTGSLPATGGTATIDVTATDDVGIAKVEVKVTAPGGQITTLLASAKGRSVYTASYSAPANSGTTEMTYKFTVSATDTSGNTGSDVEYSFKVPSAENPPPPPPFSI